MKENAKGMEKPNNGKQECRERREEDENKSCEGKFIDRSEPREWRIGENPTYSGRSIINIRGELE